MTKRLMAAVAALIVIAGVALAGGEVKIKRVVIAPNDDTSVTLDGGASTWRVNSDNELRARALIQYYDMAENLLSIRYPNPGTEEAEDATTWYRVLPEATLPWNSFPSTPAQTLTLENTDSDTAHVWVEWRQ